MKTASTGAPDLATLLADTGAGVSNTQSQLAALVEADPVAAAGWLVSNHQIAREQLSQAALSTITTSVLVAVGKVEPALHRIDVIEFISHFHDVLRGDSAAAAIRGIGDHGSETKIAAAVDQLVTSQPSHPGLLRLAAVWAARRDDHAAAHRYLTDLAREDDSQSTVHYVWRARQRLVESSSASVRLALLSSYTMDPLVAYLDLECRELNLQPSFYVAPFNTWTQEILSERSALYEFQPGIAILGVCLDDLIPKLVGTMPVDDLEAAGEEALQRVLQGVAQFLARSDSVLIVHSFYSAFVDPAGIARQPGVLNRRRWLAGLNARLEAELEQLPNAYYLDLQDVFARRTRGQPDNPKMRHLAQMRISGPILGDLARAHAQYIAPLMGLTRKCVVVDLDNTLWGGVIGEDGLHDIRLGNTSPGAEYVEFQHYLLSLTHRGFLLAINSKNNPDDALHAIRSHEAMVLREHHFSATRINWLPKPENMVSIAQQLGLGIDALVFLDDNMNERELMRQVLPQVLTPDLPADPASYRQTVEALPQLQQLALTEADRTRVRSYREKEQREQFRINAQSLNDYLESLEITVAIAEAAPDTLPRVHQLFQRTNQFNLTTRRYERAQLDEFSTSRDWKLYVLKAQDRFGDHGLVATALVRASTDRWSIDSFVMSCRTIGYGVETALLWIIVQEARATGTISVVGKFIETQKNKPAEDFYSRHGFEPGPAAQPDGEQEWWLQLHSAQIELPSWITVELSNVT